MPCLDLVIIGWELFEEGTRAVDLGIEEEKDEGMTGSAMTSKKGGGGTSIEERVSVGGGTTGIGHGEERNEGRREETKPKSKGNEGVSRAMDGDVIKGDSDWVNQVENDEEKGIWELVRWESWAKGKIVSLNKTWQAM